MYVASRQKFKKKLNAFLQMVLGGFKIRFIYSCLANKESYASYYLYYH